MDNTADNIKAERNRIEYCVQHILHHLHPGQSAGFIHLAEPVMNTGNEVLNLLRGISKHAAENAFPATRFLKEIAAPQFPEAFERLLQSEGPQILVHEVQNLPLLALGNQVHHHVPEAFRDHVANLGENIQ